eukprot:TRINITY_DN7919_c0_g1_i1.p1 TRINITY_DN7919_c0_g1~~TRINITY_DN7919_c0_g1_i1.p1  ORF type:complete len:210 (+),score=58.80 TRINITY_DN7919_c0_g1_i1:387-1016(+)
MAYSSNILVIVGLDENDNFSPKKLTIWATDSDSVLSEREFLFKIEAVRLNKSRLVACLKDKIHIYNMTNLKFLVSVNVNFPLGRLALSPSSDCPCLAYSDSIETGNIVIYDVHALIQKTEINAHKSPIIKLAINYYGTHIVTSSCKGTLVRVFSVPQGERLCSFRRGINSAQIYSLNFNINTTCVTLSSSSGTVHIFKMPGKFDIPGEE